MNNNLENALIAGGLLGIITIPLLVITRISKKKIKSAMKARLADLANKLKCQISYAEQLGDKIIALDENARKILFIGTNENNELMIDLVKVKACKLLKKMNAYEVGSIELQLRGANDMLLYVVPFYRRFIDDERDRAIIIKMAEKWRHLIHNLVKEQRKPNSIESPCVLISSN